MIKQCFVAAVAALGLSAAVVAQETTRRGR